MREKTGKTKRIIIWCIAIAVCCGIIYVAVQVGIANVKCKEFAVNFVEACVDNLEENLSDCGLKDVDITYERVGKESYSKYQNPLNKAKDYQYYFLLEYHCDRIADLYQTSTEYGAEDTFALMMRKLLDIKEDLLRQIRNQSGPYAYKNKRVEVNVDDRMERDSFLLKTSAGETYQVFSDGENYWIEVNGKRIEKMDYNAPYLDENSGYDLTSGKDKEEEASHVVPSEKSEYSGHGSFTPSDPYDVNDYDNADDFADEWADEFADSYNGDYDDGYDDAYDYWEEEYE